MKQTKTTQDIQIFSRCIGSDTYQVFIKNEGHDWDFVRVVCFNSFKYDIGKPQYVRDLLLISPDKNNTDDHFITEFDKDERKTMNFTFVLEFCKRNPSRRIASYDAVAAPHYKLPKTIGATRAFVVKKRQDDTPLDQIVENMRFNVKNQIYRLTDQYVMLMNAMTYEDIQKAGANDYVIGSGLLQQIKFLDFSKPYNAGVTYKQAAKAVGANYERYYQWFVIDFGLAPPNGAPPEKEITLPIHIITKGEQL